ncbi:MAG: MCE family protein [Proteobacteria bacterium]|nr:MCE family protein [Pseudomonadota bacterium]
MPKRVEFKVGLFIITTVLLITVFFVYIAYKKDVFSKVHTLTLSSKSGEGFSVGMPVVFSGFEIGKVKRLELNENGVVLIKIRIPERHIKWLRSDSIFILDRPLIGPPKITVYTENLNSTLLSPDKVPEVFPVDSINEAVQKVQPILDKVDTILKNSVKITSTLAGKETLLEMAVGDKASVKSINEALKKSREISYKLDSILKKVDSLTTKADGRVFGSKGILPLVRKILKDVVGKLERLNAAIDNISKTSSDVSKSTGELDKLRKDIDAAMDSTNELLKDIDRMLPLKKEKEIKLP